MLVLPITLLLVYTAHPQSVCPSGSLATDVPLNPAANKPSTNLWNDYLLTSNSNTRIAGDVVKLDVSETPTGTTKVVLSAVSVAASDFGYATNRTNKTGETIRMTVWDFSQIKSTTSPFHPRHDWSPRNTTLLPKAASTAFFSAGGVLRFPVPAGIFLDVGVEYFLAFEAVEPGFATSLKGCDSTLIRCTENVLSGSYDVYGRQEWTLSGVQFQYQVDVQCPSPTAPPTSITSPTSAVSSPTTNAVSPTAISPTGASPTAASPTSNENVASSSRRRVVTIPIHSYLWLLFAGYFY